MQETPEFLQRERQVLKLEYILEQETLKKKLNDHRILELLLRMHPQLVRILPHPQVQRLLQQTAANLLQPEMKLLKNDERSSRMPWPRSTKVQIGLSGTWVRQCTAYARPHRE